MGNQKVYELRSVRPATIRRRMGRRIEGASRRPPPHRWGGRRRGVGSCYAFVFPILPLGESWGLNGPKRNECFKKNGQIHAKMVKKRERNPSLGVQKGPQSDQEGPRSVQNRLGETKMRFRSAPGSQKEAHRDPPGLQNRSKIKKKRYQKQMWFSIPSRRWFLMVLGSKMVPKSDKKLTKYRLGSEQADP